MQRRQISWRTSFAAFWENLSPKNPRRQWYVSLCTGPVSLMNKYFQTMSLCKNCRDEWKKNVFLLLQHNSQGGAVHKNEYNSLNPDLQLPPRHQYEGTRREDSDHRRSQDTSFQDGSRGRGWQQHEYMPVERCPEHHHSPRKEPVPSNRSRYEGKLYYM